MSRGPRRGETSAYFPFEDKSALSPMELRALSLATRGLSNRQIAEASGVQEKTIKNRMSIIYIKIGVRSRSQAVVWACLNGIGPIPDGTQVNLAASAYECVIAATAQIDRAMTLLKEICVGSRAES